MNPVVKPVGRTLAELQPLKPAERVLLDACRHGGAADIAGFRPGMATEFNTVRAEVLRFLALGGDDEAPVHEHGIELQGACIEGVFDLRGAQTRVGLTLRHCYFTHGPDLRDSHIRGSLNLTGSAVPRLDCDHAVIDGGLWLRDGFIAAGTVRLAGARVGGTLNCSNARFETGGDALVCDRMVVHGSALFGQGMTASGKIRLLGVHIGGDLDCDGAVIEGGEGDALLGDRMEVLRNAFLGNGFTAHGRVRLLGAQIHGDLVCDGAHLEGKSNAALQCDRMSVGKSVLLRNGFVATGEIELSGAAIGGDLVCDGARLIGRAGTALLCDRARVGGNVLLGNGFEVDGAVRFDHARIAGSLSCVGGIFHDRGTDSVSCANAVVEGTFFFRSLRAPVSGINLKAMRVHTLVDDERSWGERLQLDGFTYALPPDAGTRGARSWIAWLDKQAAAERRGSAFKRQPWLQLIGALQAVHRAEDVSRIAIEYQQRLYQADLIGTGAQHDHSVGAQAHRIIVRVLHRLFGWLSGYGHRPLHVVAWMAGVWLVCAAAYWHAALEGVFGPADPRVYQHAEYRKCVTTLGNWYQCASLPEEYPAFSPLAYSLDLLVPFLDLRQESAWTVRIRAIHAGNAMLADSGYAVRFLVWSEIVFGWVFFVLLLVPACRVCQRAIRPP